jgi:hypothetical protein
MNIDKFQDRGVHYNDQSKLRNKCWARFIGDGLDIEGLYITIQ